MQLSKYEQETIINYNEGVDTASIYTFDKKLRQKLEHLSQKYPDQIKPEKTSQGGAASFLVPKRYVSVREPYSDARRVAARERAKKAGFAPPNRGISP